MYLLQTSGDFLNIIKAFSILLLAIFLSWFIYYLAMLTKQIFLAAKDMRERVQKVDELIKSVKEKIEHSTSYLLLISEGIKKISELALKYWEKDKKKKEK